VSLEGISPELALSIMKPLGHAALILAVWWFLRRGVALFIERLRRRLVRDADPGRDGWLETQKRIDTLVGVVRQSIFVLLNVTVALAVLMELGVAVGPLLASAGIAGIALGLGAQSLVRDLIAGFFFVLENQVRVGDVAVANGVGGMVEAMTLRTLVLRDASGTVHVFPNGTITTLANMTRDWSAYVFNVRIAWEQDPDAAIRVIRDVAAGMRKDRDYGAKIIEEPEIFGIDRMDESATVIQGRLKTRPLAQWDVGRELLRRLRFALEHEGIRMPPPQALRAAV
jgi:small conductance mechanosensitive channel